MKKLDAHFFMINQHVFSLKKYLLIKIIMISRDRLWYYQVIFGSTITFDY